ncbi:oligosaccharide flippase family protein, partial [Vibrio parahaemolyticus]|nr:oligosaccharide flippase family protein [Vibrio parahaemolyticus]
MYNNLLYKWSIQVFNLVIPVLILPLLYKNIPEEGVATFIYAESFAKLFVTFGLFGISSLGFKSLPQSKCPQNLVGELFTFGIVSNLVSFVLYVLSVCFFIDSKSVSVFYIYGLIILSNALYIEWALEACERFKLLAIKTILCRLILTIPLVYFLYRDKEIIDFVFYLVAYQFSNNVISLFLVRKIIGINFRCFIKLEQFKLMVPAYLISFALLLYMQLDKMFLGHSSSVNFLASYGIYEKIVVLSYAILSSVVFVLTPSLSRLVAKSSNDYIKSADKAFNMYVYVIILSSFLLLNGYDYLVGFLSSEKFILSYEYKLGFVLWFLTYSIKGFFISQVLYLYDKFRVVLLCILLGGFLNLTLNFLIYILNLDLGLYLLSTLVSEVLSCVFVYVNARKKIVLSKESYYDMAKIS